MTRLHGLPVLPPGDELAVQVALEAADRDLRKAIQRLEPHSEDWPWRQWYQALARLAEEAQGMAEMVRR